MANIGIDIRLIGKKQTGSEAVFFNLVKNLAKIDRVNSYKLFTDITDEKSLEKVKSSLAIEDRADFEIIPLATLNKFTWNFWTLPGYLRKNPVDIYLTQYITPWFMSKNIKVATIIHDISFNFYPRLIKKTDLFFLKTLIPLSLRRSDKIIGVSKFTRDEIIKYYKINPDKVEYIHNAVLDDFANQCVTAEKIKSVKEKYGLPERYILYMGTLQPRKNLPVLIEAYAKIKNQTGNAKLVLAGGKGHNFDERIIEEIEKNNLAEDVILPGFIGEEDKAAVMAGARIFCFPSLYEGFGIPILEAMSVGIPVIASDIAPHREIAGEAALFFDPENADELAKNILRDISDEDLRMDIVAKGKKQAGKFLWENAAEKMSAIFEKLIKIDFLGTIR